MVGSARRGRRTFTAPEMNICVFGQSIAAADVSGAESYNSHEKIMLEARKKGYVTRFTAVLEWNK